MVRLVPGDPRNIKITTPEDLELARAALAQDAGSGAARHGVRIGVGYDSHRLVQGRPLILGGVSIPHATGLAGHSDADALCHAITDAVLGAAALGDIGRHFPDTDPRWKDADSVALLRAGVPRSCEQAGFAVVECRCGRRRGRSRGWRRTWTRSERASRTRSASTAGAVSVKGKTNEGMGETGRGEGIAVHAVAC